MNFEETWQEDILLEKFIFDTYKKSTNIPTPQFNRKVRLFFYPFLFISNFLLVHIYQHNDLIVSAIQNLNSSILAISVSVIGFLVAGITIFTTLSDRRVLIELAKTEHEKLGISTFKYIFFNFLSVFVIFISSVILSLTYQLIGSLKIDLQIIIFKNKYIYLNLFFNGLFFAILITVATELLLKLKSFIWSIYATFISMMLVSEFLDSVAGRDQ
jgi:hypothetical protein